MFERIWVLSQRGTLRALMLGSPWSVGVGGVVRVWACDAICGAVMIYIVQCHTL